MQTTAFFRSSLAVTVDTSRVDNIYRPPFATDYKFGVRDFLTHLSLRSFVVAFAFAEFT